MVLARDKPVAVLHVAEVIRVGQLDLRAGVLDVRDLLQVLKQSANFSMLSPSVKLLWMDMRWSSHCCDVAQIRLRRGKDTVIAGTKSRCT